jgi:hypothetical protein
LIWTLPGVWHSVSEPMLLHPVELAAAIGAPEIATAPAPAASRRVIALTLVRMFDTPSLGEGPAGARSRIAFPRTFVVTADANPHLTSAGVD